MPFFSSGFDDDAGDLGAGCFFFIVWRSLYPYIGDAAKDILPGIKDVAAKQSTEEKCG